MTIEDHALVVIFDNNNNTLPYQIFVEQIAIQSTLLLF